MVLAEGGRSGMREKLLVLWCGSIRSRVEGWLP